MWNGVVLWIPRGRRADNSETDVTRRTGRWFRPAVAVGFLLGALLLVDTVYTFRYVVRPLVLDHVASEAGLLVSQIELAARAENPEDGAALAAMIGAVARERPDRVAWIRIADQDGHVLAAAGTPDGRPLPQAEREAVVARRVQQVARTRVTPGGEVLVVTLPFRYQFPGERGGRTPQQAGGGQPRFKLAETALVIEGAAGVFWPLRRALAINLAAAIALLAAMAVFALQFRRYVQARQVEEQLAVARRVQQQLLPRSCDDCTNLDFAVAFEPAHEVGGDFYDIFKTAHGDIALVLGDVAGKGLPAAILMGVVHGAVRAVAAGWTGTNHAALAGHLNELLRSSTADNRYVTLFWGAINTAEGRLRYVNAGHLPPLLLRRGADGRVAVERLEDGGPVLGLLPFAAYQAGEVQLREGDLLVAYSDGLSEANNAADEELGTDRVVAAAESHFGRTSAEVVSRLVQLAREFAGRQPLRDDLTLLVVRAGPART